MKRLTLLGVVVAVTVVAAVAAQAGLKPGDEAPMLRVRVLAGADTGKSLCFTCTRGQKPGALVFVTQINDMVAQFTKQLDDQAGKQGGDWGAMVIFVGDTAKQEAEIKQIAASQKITRVSLAVLDPKHEDLPKWQLSKEQPVHAYVVEKHKIKTHLAVACPHCDGLATKIAEATAK